MTLALRPLRDDELDDWAATSRARYADDIVENAGMSRAAAERKAAADWASLLPDRLATPGVAVFALEEDGAVVGHLFFAEREHDGRRLAWLYEIEVERAERGRGLGRRAMELLEDEVRRRGLDRIELNVFGGNAVARGLYRSRGFTELGVVMGKDL